MRFQDQRVVVTGAAGGIGQSLVKLFANEGAKVLAVDFSDKVADLAIEW